MTEEQFTTLSSLVTSLKPALKELQALRDKTTDEQWEAMSEDGGDTETFINSLMDVEWFIEEVFNK